MNYSKFFRTALLSLVAIAACGFGLTSCVDNKTPAELIIGTWTLNTAETYLDDALIAKQDFNKNTIEYYSEGQVIKTDTLDADDAFTLTITFDEDKTCAMTYYSEDGAERATYTYSIETVDNEDRLLLTEDGETEYAVITSLTKKDLVISNTQTDEDGDYKSVMHFKK